MAGYTFITDSLHFSLLPTAKRFVRILADVAGLKCPAEFGYLFTQNFPPPASACEQTFTAVHKSDALQWKRPLWCTSTFYVSLIAHLSITVAISNLTHNTFSLKYVYYIPLHVSSNIMLIIRRLNCINRTSSIYDRRFATLQRTLFIYLINKYISLSDICLTVHHLYK